MTYNQVKKYGSKIVNKTNGALATLATVATQAKAAIDTTASGTIATAIEENYGAGQDVGVYVIAGVLGLVVVGIIISMVKK